MFASLDFLYMPAQDIEVAIAYYVATLGGSLVWKIRDEDTVVANVKLSETGPAILLASHLHGASPILIYRVADVVAAAAEMRGRGWQPDGDAFELPHGPCYTFAAPGGQRLAIYQLVRPETNARWIGRIDP